PVLLVLSWRLTCDRCTDQGRSRRRESSARPNMPAWPTCSSASTGSSAMVLPSAVTFSVPTVLFLSIGATSGSLRVSEVLILSAVPFGTVTYRSWLKPIFRLFCEPFQTFGVSTAWSVAYRRTVSKLRKPQCSSFWLACVRIWSDEVPSTTEIRRRSPFLPFGRLAVEIRQ